MSVTLKLAVSRSRPPVPCGANLFDLLLVLCGAFNVCCKRKEVWQLKTIQKRQLYFSAEMCIEFDEFAVLLEGPGNASMNSDHH